MRKSGKTNRQSKMLHSPLPTSYFLLPLFCLLHFLLPPSLSASIGASGTAAVCKVFNAASGTVTRTEAAGDTVVVAVAIRTTTSTVSSVSDTGGSNYGSSPIVAINNSTNARAELWSTAVGGSTSSTSVTITLGASSKFVGCVFEYTGVVALGNTGTFTGNGNSVVVNVTTQDANNWCTSSAAAQGTGTFSQNVGTLRASAVTSGGQGSSNVGGALTDNTIATPGTCSMAPTISTQENNAGVGVELRSTSGGGAVAKHQLLTLGVGR